MNIEQLLRQSLSFIFLITAFTLIVYADADIKPVGESINRRFPLIFRSQVAKDMASIITSKTTNVDIVFSDIDGTLIHYPENLDDYLKGKGEGDVCLLPASSTGMVGVISATTLQLVREIRQTGAVFVLVSGMRSSTLLRRIPYLPKADAYCCENGGRIFYPTRLQSSETCRINPRKFLGANSQDLQAFSLIEDIAWRRKMEHMSAAGTDGFVGKELNSDYEKNEKEIPCFERRGFLWDFARTLLEKGFSIDTVGYCTCFRVNRKQQDNARAFETLINRSIEVPTSLASSTNLGCVDFYPIVSGKKNCCDYLREKFSSSCESKIGQCLCLCDDDNDIEMALSCMHVYLPLVSSASMEECVKSNHGKFTVMSTSKSSNDGIEAIEKALFQVLDRLN